MSTSVQCALNGSDTICVDDNLLISFKRTLRIPEDHQESFSPPDLGAIPLKNAASYTTKLPAEAESKNGLILPMYESDAAWIHFAVKTPTAYLVKIYVDGINAVSGEPALEDDATYRRRQAKYARDPASLQDYIVVPEQLWLDGVADVEGNVQQFALPLPKPTAGGKDAARTIQFEVTPYEQAPPKPVEDDEYSIMLRNYMPRTLVVKAHPDDTVECFKRRVEEVDRTPVHQQRLIYTAAGKKPILLEDVRKLSDYEIPKDATVHLVLRLHGGREPHELKIAADGKRKQVINPDPKCDEWRPERTAVFNVHMVRPAVYQAITGARPPLEPIGKEAYEKHGVRYLEEYEESGDEVAAVGFVKDGGGNGGEESGTVRSDEFINPKGPLRAFRTLRDLEKEYSG